MDSFFEQMINGFYQEAQAFASLFSGYPPYRCTIIKFGGFQFSHNWYGKTRMNYDKVGNLKVFSKTIYLNSLFITQQFGITNNSEYNLPNLSNTLAHEIAHCLRADYEPEKTNEHDSTHASITVVIDWYIRNSYEFWLLEQLFKSQSKYHPSLTHLKKYDH